MPGRAAASGVASAIVVLGSALVNQPYYVNFMPGYAGSLNDAWNNDKIMYT